MANFFNDNLYKCKKCGSINFKEHKTFSVQEVECKNLITKDKKYKIFFEKINIYCAECNTVANISLDK